MHKLQHQDYKARLKEIINANPQTTEERHSAFLMKKLKVDKLLEERVIDGDQFYARQQNHINPV